MKTVRIVVGLLLFGVLVQEQSLGAQRVLATLAGAKDVLVDSFCDYVGIRTEAYVFDQQKCNRWLATQNYAELSTELYQLLDSGIADVQMVTHQWLVGCLSSGSLDPLLLYMDARTVLKHRILDPVVYERALTHLALCIVMTDISYNVLTKMGRTESKGHNLEDVGAFLRTKFVAQFAATTFTSEARNRVSFEKIRDGIVASLSVLSRSDDSVGVLPLPFWMLRTRCGWMMGMSGWSIGGWGISWGAVCDDEHRVRHTSSTMGFIVNLTQQELQSSIAYLQQQRSWNDFLLPNVDVSGVAAFGADELFDPEEGDTASVQQRLTEDVRPPSTHSVHSVHDEDGDGTGKKKKKKK